MKNPDVEMLTEGIVASCLLCHQSFPDSIPHTFRGRRKGRNVVLDNGCLFFLPSHCLVWHEIHKGDRVQIWLPEENVNADDLSDSMYLVRWWHGGEAIGAREGDYFVPRDIVNMT